MSTTGRIAAAILVLLLARDLLLQWYTAYVVESYFQSAGILMAGIGCMFPVMLIIATESVIVEIDRMRPAYYLRS